MNSARHRAGSRRNKHLPVARLPRVSDRAVELNAAEYAGWYEAYLYASKPGLGRLALALGALHHDQAHASKPDHAARAVSIATCFPGALVWHGDRGPEAARRADDCGRFAATLTVLARVERYERQTGRSPRHYFAAGTSGLPGECAADCGCGVYYAGFDTIGEAGALLDRHIARNAYDHLTASQRRRLRKKARSVGEFV